MQGLKLYTLFFQSTLKINLPLSLLGCLIIAGFDWMLFYKSFFYMFGGIGIVASLFFKEVFEKAGYFYYYNAGIPKRRLIVVLFLYYWLFLLLLKLCVICLR